MLIITISAMSATANSMEEEKGRSKDDISAEKHLLL